MYLLFDIGGTKMRLGVSSNGTAVDKITTLETPQNFEQGILEIKKGVHDLVGDSVPYGIALGIAGAVGREKDTLLGSPNLPGWVGKPLAAELKKIFGAPVFIENDAVLAGMGEAHDGAGRGFNIVVYVTVSTGVGGARIVNKRVDDKAIGFEPGHQVIDIDRTLIPGAISGTLENYISGTEALHETGHKPKDITDPKFWDDKARLLAYGLNNMIVHWSPDVVVLGGSMINGDPAISIEKTEKYLHEILKIYTELPKLKKAELGDNCGLYGALEYLKQQRL